MIGLAIGIAVFACYVATLCPTVFTDDSGEIATAVATGGVMHPPGYPLYCILGGMLVRILPFGEPAWRLGLLSAACAASAVSVVFFLCRRIGVGRVWSGAAALALAFSYALWQQATKVETYALNALFVAVILYLAIGYAQSGRRGDFLLTALAAGFALTNHLTIVALAPAALLLTIPVLMRTENRRDAALLLLAGAGCALAPLALYGYEIVAARAHPGGQVWGDTTTLHNLWLHVTGARYHRLLFALSATEMMVRDGQVMPRLIWRSMEIMLPLSAAGAVAMGRTQGRGSIAIALVVAALGYIACDTVYAILNIFEYYTPVVIALTILAAAGGQSVCDWTAFVLARTGQARAGMVLAGGLAIVAIALPLMAAYRACDRHEATYLRDLAENTLRTMPPNSVILVRGDNRLFPLWYVQDVLGIRRDVVVIPDSLQDWSTPLGRAINGWTAAKLDAAHPELHDRAILAAYADGSHAVAGMTPPQMLLREAVAMGRPAFLSAVSPEDIGARLEGAEQIAFLPRYAFVPYGLCAQAEPIGTILDRDVLARDLKAESQIRYEYAPPALFENEPDGPVTNHVYARSLTYTAQMLGTTGRWPQALARAELAYRFDHTQAPTDNIYAVACANCGRTRDAIAAWRRALAIDPENAAYRRNLSTALAQVASAEGAGE